jgi:hypothetical protein
MAAGDVLNTIIVGTVTGTTTLATTETTAEIETAIRFLN